MSAPGDLPQITPHARRRMQQRGISAAALARLLALGRVKHQNGGMLVYIDREGRAGLDERHERLAAVYAVLDRGGARVVTVGHRTRNLRVH